MKDAFAHPKDHRLSWADRHCLLQELVMVGWDSPERANAMSLGPHLHVDSYELCYIVEGRAEWWVDGGRRAPAEVFIVEPGHLFITRPGEVHGGVNSVLHLCELYWLQIKIRNHRLPGMSSRQSVPIARKLQRLSRVMRASDQIRAAFAAIVVEHCRRDAWSAALARAALHDLLARICREHDSDQSPAVEISPAVQASMRWMLQHLAEDFGMREPAAVAKLSATQFQFRFHKEVGYTPGDWRVRQRLAMSKNLLQERERSILDAAMACGFSTSQYFATSFRRILGITPGEFRRRSAK